MRLSKTGKKFLLSKYQIFLVAILAIAQFTVMLDFMIISPLGAHLNRILGINSSQFGLVVSAYAFSASIAGLVSALIADMYDRKRLLLIFYTGFITGTFLCALSNSYSFLLISRIITGVFGGVISAMIYAIITDIFSFEIRGRVISYIQIASSVSQVIGIPLGLFLTDKFNWHIPFLSIAALGLVVLIILLKKMAPIKKQLNTDSNEYYKRFIKIIKSKRYSVAYISTGLLAIGGFILMPFASIFLVHNVGISESELPLIYMAAGGCTIFAGPLIGIFSDKVGKLKVFIYGSFIVLPMVALYTNLPHTSLYIVILVNCLLYLGVSSRIIPGMALITTVPKQKERGSFMSINSSVQQFSGGIASIAGGIITYQKPDGILQNFNILGAITILLVITSIFFMRRIEEIIQ